MMKARRIGCCTLLVVLAAACATPGPHVPQAPLPRDGDVREDREVPDLAVEIPPAAGGARPRAPDREQRLIEADRVAEILVIGRRLEEGVPDVPFDSVGSRNVFGPEQVRETGARNLNDLVQHLPALSTRPYNGGEAAAPSFSMRGLPDDGLTEFVHVLIDGVPASSLPYGWTAFSFLPITPERIYAVDYLRGAHTVRYSPDTVGGVLNFLTQPIPREPMVTTRVTVGDEDFLSAMVSAGGTVGDVGLLATHVQRGGDGYRRDGEWDQNDSNVKARWQIDEDRWLAGSFSYMESAHKAPGGLTLAQFDADRFGNARPDNEFTGHRTVLDLLYHSDAGEDSWWEGFVQGAETTRHLRAQRPHFGDAATISDWTDTAYFYALGARGEADVEVAGSTHTLFGGVRFHREWIPDWDIFSRPVDGSPATQTMASHFYLSTLSAHVDDTWKPVDGLTLLFGVRLEWVPSAKGSDSVSGFTFDDDFFAALPGVGASYEITERLVAFANYNEGFRAPQVFGFGSARPGDDLDFEESTIVEAGLRAKGPGGLSGAATWWRTDYDDFHVFTTDGFFENLGRIVAEGVDLEAEWQAGEVWGFLEGFSISGAVTLQDSELRSGAFAGNETPYAWEQKATWRFRYTKADWSASLGGVFVGDSFSDDANTVAENANGNLGLNPSRTLWDLQLARRFALGEKGEARLAGGITNLFDHDWFVHSRGGFFGGGKVAGQPRNAYVSFDLILNW